MNEEQETLPITLLQKCGLIVRSHHKQFGFGDLSKCLTNKDYMPLLASMEDTMVMISNASTFFKIQKLLWVTTFISLLVSLFLSIWFLSVSILAVIIDRIISRNSREGYMYMSTTILGLEMLVNNFAKIGNKYPEDKLKALEKFKYVSENPHTFWLDYYLPRRNEISNELLQEFTK